MLCLDSLLVGVAHRRSSAISAFDTLCRLCSAGLNLCLALRVDRLILPQLVLDLEADHLIVVEEEVLSVVDPDKGDFRRAVRSRALRGDHDAVDLVRLEQIFRRSQHVVEESEREFDAIVRRRLDPALDNLAFERAEDYEPERHVDVDGAIACARVNQAV